MSPTYLTIQSNGQQEIEIRHSRFICTLHRIESEEEAKELIQATKKEHWKANHNCVAYVLGEKNEIQRAFDDGEPSGTAGVPMLEVLKKNELRNVLAIVTRYFGGVKLGAGGLIRAYSTSVSEALHAIGIVRRVMQVPIHCTVSYAASGKFENRLLQTPYEKLDTFYTDVVTFLVGVPVEEQEEAQAIFTDWMNGNVTFEIGEPDYVEVPVETKTVSFEEE